MPRRTSGCDVAGAGSKGPASLWLLNPGWGEGIMLECWPGQWVLGGGPSIATQGVRRA